MGADSYYAPYICIGIAGALSCCVNWKGRRFPEGRWESGWTLLFSFVLAMAVMGANYRLFVSPERLWAGTLITLAGVWLGGMVCFGNILFCLSGYFQSLRSYRENRTYSPFRMFILLAMPMAVINLSLLFFSEYPGILTYDSMVQMGQIVNGEYSNHHPFYHTMLIGLFVKAGCALWGNINAGVALYNAVQVLTMACCFSYGMVTVCQAGAPVKYVVAGELFYALMPFHMLYSFTVWKDVIFGAFILLFLTAAFRELADIGSHRSCNHVMFVLGGLGICLFRSNGWVAYLLVFAAFLLLFGRRKVKLCFVFLSILLVSFLLKHPVLTALDVAQPDTAEALAIPMQQIARVITEGHELTEGQMALLNEIVEVDQIPAAYVPSDADLVKELIRQKDNQAYLVENKWAFLKLYVEIGLAHPREYVDAWIDQTRGYWNGGYPFWIWGRAVDANDFGISGEVRSVTLNQYLSRYLAAFERSSALQLFLSIGFHVWIVLAVCYISLMRRDRVVCFLTIPLLAVIATLLVATPEFSEFRYAYSVFCTLPFLICALFTDRVKT